MNYYRQSTAKQIERRAYIAEHHKQMNSNEIAEALGVALSTVKKDLKEMGIKCLRKGCVPDEVIVAYIREHPKTKIVKLCEMFHCSSERISIARAELGITRNFKNSQTQMSQGQLCWNCKKATGAYDCSWAERLEYPEGVFINKNGFIKKCPLFEFGR